MDAGTAAMIIGVGPILVALLSSRLLREQISRFLLIGLAVSFLGTIVVGLSISDGGEDSVGGVLLCLLAAASVAGGVVLQKPALRHASASQVTTFGCIIGTAASLPFTGQLVSQLAGVPLPAKHSSIAKVYATESAAALDLRRGPAAQKAGRGLMT